MLEKNTGARRSLSTYVGGTVGGVRHGMYLRRLDTRASQSRKDTPLLPLAEIFPPAVALLHPWSSPPFCVHLVDLLHLQADFWNRLLEERHYLCASGVEAGDDEDTRLGGVGEKIFHRFREVLVLPEHPETVCGQDTGVAVGVGGCE